MTDQAPGAVPVERWFRREYGRLVATLCRRVGMGRLEAVEDAVQGAVVVALERWPVDGTPRDPSAWLYRTAYNGLLDDLRMRARRRGLLERQGSALVEPPDLAEPPLAGEVRDDQLRMIVVCCDEALPMPTRWVLALKVLCGFQVPEIAVRLFTTEANVYQRLQRGRRRLQEQGAPPDRLQPSSLPGRLPSVLGTIYLLFTEGYLSSRPDVAIRRELCDEALRLAGLLAHHRPTATPETFALLALMELHGARLGARQDAAGGLLLLEEQDRSVWDQQRIAVGLKWLARSAEGDRFSRYHAEAGIAAEHCLAPSFAATRWDRVATAYAQLETLAPSALHRLNRAVAVAEAQGPEAGLAVIAGAAPPTWLEGSYQWSAVLADLHGRAGHVEAAARHRRVALETAPTPAIRALLERRLSAARSLSPPRSVSAARACEGAEAGTGGPSAPCGLPPTRCPGTSR